MQENASVQTDPVAIQVLVVDDSAIVRGIISRALKDQADIEVTNSAINGRDAIDKLTANPHIEVVVLDIEMPEMTGMEALPELLKAVPDVKILMASTLTKRNADISLQALSLGAADYVPKPSMQERESLPAFYEELITKIRALGLETKRRRGIPLPKLKATEPAAVSVPLDYKPKPAAYPIGAPRALAIASSTGGPQALTTLFSDLKGACEKLPIFITQHMPPTFTNLLAKNLAKSSGRIIKEAEEGEMVQNGVVYIAPGDYHMLVKQRENGMFISLNQKPPVNYCRPAADPMIESLSEIYGNRLMVAVLTGMGQDGAEGSKLAASKGATVIIQDEASSVVWGMPGAVAKMDIASAALPISEIAAYLKKAGGG